MTKRPIVTTFAVLALVGLVVVGCGGGGGAGSESESGDETGSTGSSHAAAAWERVVPGGDCQCADGSEFSFFVQEGDPNRVLLHFGGGGACWNAATCSQPESEDNDEGLYSASVDDHPRTRGGIFDLDDERNPFADWTIVFVPYCTADVFTGNATTEYAPDLTVQHKGYVNGNAAVDHVAGTFPDATRVVVSGLSAGSVAAPLYGGLVSDRFPDADITVLADGSGAYTADVADDVATVWGLAGTIPDWPENAGLSAEEWASPPGLYVQAGLHDPDITFARHDYAYDRQQVMRNGLLGIPGDLLSLMDANEAQIESAGVDVASYTAPGDDHGVLQYDSFYEEEVDGVALVDWVTSLVNGDPVSDVHCTDCQPA